MLTKSMTGLESVCDSCLEKLLVATSNDKALEELHLLAASENLRRKREKELCLSAEDHFSHLDISTLGTYAKEGEKACRLAAINELINRIDLMCQILATPEPDESDDKCDPMDIH